uniref:ABC transporter domain-containing protein n=1 Tax=Noctiluca scintillans TaxID=2966 RepID=A0A7S0ZQ51_NOCSC
MANVSVGDLVALVRRFATELGDETVIEYIAAVALDAADVSELEEICEPYVEDHAKLVAELQVALSLTPVLRKCSGAQKQHITAAQQQLVCTASEALVDHTDEVSVENLNPTSRGAKSSKKRESRAMAKRCQDGPSPSYDLVEITAQVSRFHKELVEDEVTSSVSNVDIHGVTMSVSGITLLEDAHLKLCPGQRYGFVGRNGCGKSSLLHAMVSKRIPGYPAQCTTMLVAQEDVGDDRTPVDTVLCADVELASALKEEEVLLPCEDGTDEGATRALRNHALLLAREELRRAAAFESKSSGQRGREARKWLLAAEAKERDAALLCDSSDLDPDAGGQAVELLAETRERLRTLNVGQLMARAEVLLLGLGLSREDLSCSTSRLSGGWRMRVALAKALFAQPDVLLLDEPTNHLDWAAILWLEKYLQSHDMETVAMVVVSHDRTFLDNVCTMILRVHDKKLQLHSGNFSAFESAHQENQQHRAELAAKVAEKRAVVEKQVHSMEQRGRKTNNENLLKQVASRKNKMGLSGPGMTAYNRVGLERVDGHKWKASYGSGYLAAEAAMTTEVKDAEVKLRLKAGVPLGNDAPNLQCQGTVVGFTGSEPLVKPFDLDVRMTSRVGLLGVNGSGKTTLLRTLAKELTPLKGDVYQAPRVVLGFFNQNQADGLPLELTSLEVLRQRYPEVPESEARGHLGSFGMGGRQAVQPIRTLSGGEKCRVALAAITLRPPHLLLLDEPTNHLDLNTVEALGKALREYEGGVVVASHDRRLLKDVCTDFFAVQDRRLQKTTLEQFVKVVRAANEKS